MSTFYVINCLNSVNLNVLIYFPSSKKKEAVISHLKIDIFIPQIFLWLFNTLVPSDR